MELPGNPLNGELFEEQNSRAEDGSQGSSHPILPLIRAGPQGLYEKPGQSQAAHGRSAEDLQEGFTGRTSCS